MPIITNGGPKRKEYYTGPRFQPYDIEPFTAFLDAQESVKVGTMTDEDGSLMNIYHVGNVTLVYGTDNYATGSEGSVRIILGGDSHNVGDMETILKFHEKGMFMTITELREIKEQHRKDEENKPVHLY
ncbi:MAG: hypothetical protein AABX82_04335 [Nanoarchaeota archaeon]